MPPLPCRTGWPARHSRSTAAPTPRVPTSRDKHATRQQMRFSMTAATICSLVHVAYAHSTNTDPSAAGALSGNFSQSTSYLGMPEAADALAYSSLYCAVGLSGWAAFRFLVRQLAPGHLDGDGDGSKEVIPSNSEVWQHSWPMWRVPGPATCLLSDPGAPPLPHTTQSTMDCRSFSSSGGSWC